MKHPIKKGPQGGRFQCSHGEKRYLNNGKVKVGPQGGRFQPYGRGKKRFLLKVK